LIFAAQSSHDYARFFAPLGAGVNEEPELDEVKINEFIGLIPDTHKIDYSYRHEIAKDLFHFIIFSQDSGHALKNPRQGLVPYRGRGLWSSDLVARNEQLPKH
jgi:hypothetical protein